MCRGSPRTEPRRRYPYSRGRDITRCADRFRTLRRIAQTPGLSATAPHDSRPDEVELAARPDRWGAATLLPRARGARGLPGGLCDRASCRSRRAIIAGPAALHDIFRRRRYGALPLDARAASRPHIGIERYPGELRPLIGNRSTAATTARHVGPLNGSQILPKRISSHATALIAAP